MYSVLPELNQTPSMYNYESRKDNRPTDRLNPHKMKFTDEIVIILHRQEEEEVLRVS